MGVAVGWASRDVVWVWGVQCIACVNSILLGIKRGMTRSAVGFSRKSGVARQPRLNYTYRAKVSRVFFRRLILGFKNPM